MYQEESAKTGTQTPAVGLEMQILEKNQAELMEIVSALESRLLAVMRESEPSGPRDVLQNSGNHANSPLAVSLHKRVQEIESVCARLSSIMRRLEI